MSDSNKNGASARDRTIALLGALALVLLIVVGIGYAALDGRDLASFAPTLLGFATPTIVALLGMSGVRANIGRMETKVNGNYDELSTRNEELALQLGSATGAMPAVTPPPPQPTYPVRAYSAIPPAPDPPPPFIDPYATDTGAGRHRWDSK